MEKISGKKELYFMRYSISRFRNFFEIFFEFLGTFAIFEHIYKNSTSIFELELYINAHPRNKRTCGTLLLHNLNQRLGSL